MQKEEEELEEEEAGEEIEDMGEELYFRGEKLVHLVEEEEERLHLRLVGRLQSGRGPR